MDEQFHESRRVSRDAIQALIAQTSDGPGLRRFAIQYGLLVGSALLVVGGPAWALSYAVVAPAMVVFALMTMGMFATVHESGHNTAFRTRRLNRLVCWLASVPIYYTPTSFREFHFAHHRHTHDPMRDPEISIGGEPAPGVTSSLPMYFGFLSGLPLLLFKVAMLVAASVGVPGSIWTRLLPHVSPRARSRVSWEARIVLSMHVLWVVAGLLWLPGLLHLLLAQVLGHFLLTLYITTEHNGRPHEGDIFSRTRTTLAPPLLRWLMWNMPYHAEHHAYPAVPWSALPALHRLVTPELRAVSPGYFSFHRRVLASLFRGVPFQEAIHDDTGITLSPASGRAADG